MADNGHVQPPTSEVEAPRIDGDRRAFFKRSAMIGIPLVVATVRPRTAWAQMTQSCAGSTHASGCNPDGQGVINPNRLR
jgi:hypothetical protein